MGRKTKQNRITSPDLIKQINPKNIRLMNDFLEYLRSVGKAESTVNAYSSDLYIFFVWALQNADNKYFPEISKRDIVAYQNWLLRNNENSPARVRRLKSRIIDFAMKVADEDAVVSREEFNRIFKVYSRYEKYIGERGLTNGEVDVSIQIIRDAYEKHMKNHTFIEDVRGY